MSVILLPGFFPLRSLRSLDNNALALHGGLIVVDIDGKKYGLPQTLMRRAGHYPPEVVFRGGTDLLSNMAHDGDAFVRCGYTTEWNMSYRLDLDLLYGMFKKNTGESNVADVNAHLSTGARAEALSLARRVLIQAQAAGVRGLFVSQVSDLQTEKGLYRALQEIASKATVKMVGDQFLAVGIDQPTLDRVSQLAGDLHQGVTTKSEAKAGKKGMQAPMLAAAAMLLGDMTMVCTSAKAEFSKDRALVYRVGRFLGVPSRRGKGQPAASGATTTPQSPATDMGTQTQSPPGTHASVPGTHVPAHHSTNGHQGTQGHHTSHATPVTTPAPAMTPPTPVMTPMPIPGPTPTPAMAPAPTPAAVSTTPATGTPSPVTPPHVTPLIPGQPVPLVPGTVLATLPVAGGPPLLAVVQPDGTTAWVPSTTAPQQQPSPQLPPQHPAPPHQPHRSHRTHKRHGGHAGRPPRTPKRG